MSSSGATSAGDAGPAVPDHCLVAARAADAKSAEDTVVLAMGELLGLTDAFVITSGRNRRQVRTIVDEVERQVRASGDRSPARVEGLDDASWVLLDYGDFLVHVFLDESRRFYDLEHLWSGAPRVPWDGVASGSPGPSGGGRSGVAGRGAGRRWARPVRSPARRWRWAPRWVARRSRSWLRG